MKKILLSMFFAASIFGAMAEEKVFFTEDFEWLSPWAIAGDNNGKEAGNTVETGDVNAYCPQLITPKVDEMSAFEALKNKGYDFVFRYAYDKNPEKWDVAIYLQKNYLKFNKTGNLDGDGYQTGIVLPSISDIPSGINLKMSFDWCSMKQGSGVFDKTNLVVIVENGDNDIQYPVPAHIWEDNQDFEWVSATINLGTVTVDADTKISVRTTDEDWNTKTAHRWFIDNIKLYSDASSGIAEVTMGESENTIYYSPQGIRVDNPGNGIYIKQEGNRISKVKIGK